MDEKKELLDKVDKDYHAGKITEEEYAAFLVEMFESVAPIANKPPPVANPAEATKKELKAALEHVVKGTTTVQTDDEEILTRAWMPLNQLLENIDLIAGIDKTITKEFLAEVRKIVLCAFATDREELRKRHSMIVKPD
ncbi:MAG: hypothetical protein ACWGOX_05600 [Desulforhopalus sp.]